MNLKIKFIPYEKFKKDSTKAVLKDLQSNTIVLIDAKLKPEEEASLIKATMENVSDKFTGVELSSLELSKENKNIGKFRNMLVEALIGKKRGLTILGPAKIVHKIKKNPEELLLYM